MPRAGLTSASVVAAAADLADAVGWERLTLAELAGRLNVAVPSLYKHLDGLDAVRRGVALLALASLRDALATAVAEAPPTERLAALASAYRSWARAHPGRFAATVRAAPRDDAELGNASAAVLGVVLGVLAERGIDGDDAIDATRVLRSGLHGFVSLELAGGFGLPHDVERSFGRLVEVLDRGLAPT